ncbi:sensor histidine kinase [Vitiosangium sp. GDMCC 1.1324]|uniref:sensor histidine kinase n=1 Tax=Vitiosangium sp. (strain GDMCC 1.1324) TaxID=2138576 RepID=UPI001E396B7E|nr:HAMP domain-containing sensor histidine kinase [Vitiosangium sp. GDMCC 1.1324]
MHPRRPSRGGRQSDAIALRPSPARGLGHEDPEPDEEQARLRRTLAEREHLRTLGEMVLGVAHDLNNTLNAMKLRLELIQRDTRLAARQRDNLEALERIVSDASTRVHHLQDFARRHREERNGEPVLLAEVVREAMEIARGDLEQRAAREGLTLRLDVKVPPLPPVSGSAADLRYVLINLLLNARDAMPRGGTIRVRGRHQRGQVILTVEDEGTGISQEHLPSIFEPFFTTKGRQGTGLGLAMAHGVISRAGGTITATNRPRGGARFTLTVPALSTPKPARRPARKKPTPERKARHAR